jgi:hypothetical protein
MLAHINPQEAAMLQSMGGAGTINPQTGLREFYQIGNLLANSYQAPVGTYDGRVSSPAAPAPFDIKFADTSGSGGMGVQQIKSYTLPSDQTFADIPLVTNYDPKGNFNFLTLEPGQYLTPDPSQPNIISVPRLNAGGEVIDWGISDLNEQDNGSFGSFVRGLASDFGPMILAGLGANLLAPAAGALGTGTVTLPLSGTLATLEGANTFSAAGANSAAPILLSGALNTGGTGTTTFPHIFHQPTGATAATAWSSGANSGTVYGCNEATGFLGNFADYRIAGARHFSLGTDGSGNSRMNFGSAGYYIQLVSTTFSVSGGLSVGGGSITASGGNGIVSTGTLAVTGATTLTGLLTTNGGITLGDAQNIAFNTTTGTKIGTATTQKIGFWNATPVVQQSAVADASGGAVIDSEARTALNSLLAKLRTLGIIAT